MLLIVGVIVWCWGLLSHRQMLRHQGMVKSRCCVLFSDLKVFLLRPPGPPASQPSFLPMSAPDTETHANGVADNNNTLINTPQADGWTAPPAGGATADDASVGAEGWSSSAAERSATLDCSSSSDDLAKEKSEERLSLTSCTDSGVRTPLCRICFQGPEQVCTRFTLQYWDVKHLERTRYKSGGSSFFMNIIMGNICVQRIVNVCG